MIVSWYLFFDILNGGVLVSTDWVKLGTHAEVDQLASLKADQKV